VLLQERQQNGVFKSLSDVCKRANSQKVNKRVLETLIKSGAFDSLGGTRRAMLAFLPEAMRMAEQHHRDQLKGQTDLFGGMFGDALGTSNESIMSDLAEFPEKERLQLEKETLGLYLTGHPLDEYKQEIEGLPHRMPLVDLAEDEHTKYKKQAVMLAGLVSNIRTQNTDNGKRAFVQLDDNTGYYEALIFTDTYTQYAELLEKDNCVVLEGVLDTNFSGKTRLRVEKIHNMQSVRENFLRRVYFKLSHDQKACFAQLKPYLIQSDNPKHQVIIDYRGVKAKTELKLGGQWQVALGDESLKAMREILEKDQLRLVF
jgi:DNA polymerase-3 subunit alpha